MNKLTFKFGQNSITYEHGQRYITINGEKNNAGKYYYLEMLESFSEDDAFNKQMLLWITDIYKATNFVYNPDIIRYACDVQKKVTDPAYAGIDAFLAVIYLAMLDCEASKPYPNSLGKDIVFLSCKAVLLKQKAAREAAVMFTKDHKRKIQAEYDLEDDFQDDYQFHDDHYDCADYTHEDAVMDALENGNGEYYGY